MDTENDDIVQVLGAPVVIVSMMALQCVSIDLCSPASLACVAITHKSGDAYQSPMSRVWMIDARSSDSVAVGNHPEKTTFWWGV